MLTLYFSDVDSALHRYGTETPEEGNAIKKVDNSLADLRAGIESLGLTDRVNLVVVSDHGMTNIDPEFMVYLDDYIDLDKVFVPVFNSKDGPRAIHSRIYLLKIAMTLTLYIINLKALMKASKFINARISPRLAF